MKKTLFTILFIPIILFSQQQVKGNFSPAKDYTYAFLYKSSPDGADYVERAKLDSLGNFAINLPETAETGIYKVVYAIPPEENNFDFIYNGKEDVAFNFSLDKGVEFTESSENKLWGSYLKSMEMVNQTISNYYAKESKDKTAFKAIFKTLKDTQTAYEESAKDNLVAAFINSNKPYVPKSFEDVTTYSKNIEANYFSPMDFNNSLLQSSSFIRDRVDGFIFNLSDSKNNDSYKKHLDILASALVKYSPKIRSSQFEILWQQFSELGNHEVANYITDTYLLDLAKLTKNMVLEQTITSYKGTSLGAIAPDFEIMSAPESLMLSELKGEKQYVLIFWSSTCGHCLNELPKVKNLFEGKPGTKVIAYGLESEDSTWPEEIKNYPDFIHGIGLGKWDNPIVKTYAIGATPTYFVLDTNKKIVAKPYDFESLEAYFNGR